MNEAPMMAILALACGSTSAYILFRPEAVKRANESERYRGMGFGSKPSWFWRMLGIVGVIGSSWLLIFAWRLKH
jgi:hypothetical protein